MTSAAQAAANRRNARHSTGPRTKAGKTRVARNALRHGLAVPINILAEYGPTIERLAKLLAGNGADGKRLELASRVAEAEIDVCRARRARIAVLQRPLVREETSIVKGPSPGRHARDLLRLAKKVHDSGGVLFWGELLRQLERRPTRTVIVSQSIVGEDDHFATAIAERSSELRRIDRYERRALSRRKSAIRALDSLNLVSAKE